MLEFDNLSWSLLIYVIPLFIPFIIYLLINQLVKKKLAFLATIHLSTLINLFLIMYLFKELVGQTLIAFILIFFIILIAFILILQWKNKNEVLLIKAVRIALRAMFLISFTTYIGQVCFIIGRIIYRKMS